MTMTMTKKIKNIVASFILISFSVLVLGSMFTPEASAQGREVPVGDSQGRQSQQQTLQNRVQDLTQSFQEWADVIVTSKLKQELIKQIQEAALGSVSGSGGQLPSFVTNYLDYFEDLAVGVLGEFANTVDSVSFCSNFSRELKLSFGGQGGQGSGSSGGTFGQGSNCTLQNTLRPGTTVDEFLEGNFLAGGYEGFLSAWSPENNLFGAFLETYHEQERLVEEELNAKAQQIGDAQGFLGAEDAQGQITKPGIVTKDLLTKSLGSDIDFIVNADSFLEIAMNALTTAISQAIDKGLNEVTVSGGGNAQQLKQEIQSISNANFASSKRDVVNRIQEAITQRNGITGVLTNNINATNNYITTLAGYLTQISQKLTSVNKPNSPQCTGAGFNTLVNISSLRSSLNNEINRAQNLITQLTAERNSNNLEIPFLTSEKNEIDSFTNTPEGRAEFQTKLAEPIATITGSEELAAKERAQRSLNDNQDFMNSKLNGPNGFIDLMSKFNQCINFS
jgi:hypothetical protein